MNTSKIYFFLFSFAFFLPSVTAQQETVITEYANDAEASESPFSFEATVDAYYNYSTLKQDSYTAMVLRHNKPELGFVNASVAYDGNKFGGLLSLAAGPRADQFYDFDEKKGLKYIRQAYLYFAPVEPLTLYVGSASSYFGYTYDEPYKNPNYSSTYLNSTTAANLTGIWSEYAINENFTLTTGVFNDLDLKIDVTPGVHIGGALAYSGDKFEAMFGYINGEEALGRMNIFDFMADYQLSESNALGLELYRTAFDDGISDKLSFNAINLYLMHDFSDNAALNFCFEYFADKDGFYFETEDNNVIDLTLTGKLHWKKFIFMPEIRQDIASKAVFFDETGQEKKKGFSFILGLNWSLNRGE